MRKLLLLLPLILVVSTTAQKKPTLLAVFPHPDDESALAEALVVYSKLGFRVQLIIATDGKDGTRVTKIPAGGELGRLRKDESRCAAKKLGIEEPIFLGIDRLDTRIGVVKYFAEHRRFRELLKEQVLRLNPKFILTFGPDGDTSHSEHIVAGAAVTEVLLSEGWVEKYPLYYLAWKKEEGETSNLGYVHEKYLSVTIKYSQAEEDKALEIMPCYVTQYTIEEIREDREKKLADKYNVLYFRRFSVAAGIRTRF